MDKVLVWLWVKEKVWVAEVARWVVLRCILHGSCRDDVRTLQEIGLRLRLFRWQIVVLVERSRKGLGDSIIPSVSPFGNLRLLGAVFLAISCVSVYHSFEQRLWRVARPYASTSGWWPLFNCIEVLRANGLNPKSLSISRIGMLVLLQILIIASPSNCRELMLSLRVVIHNGDLLKFRGRHRPKLKLVLMILHHIVGVPLEYHRGRLHHLQSLAVRQRWLRRLCWYLRRW